MSLRDLPSVDRLLAQSDELVGAYGRPLTTQAYREVLEAARAQLRGPANGSAAPTFQDLVAQARARLADLTAASLRPVINATGVIIHTNLGRAPLSAAALAEAAAAARGYSNLEYDLEGGERGSRSTHVEGLLTQLTGAEAALVVNNNAAALLLMLAALAQGQGVVIARSQLVEIGGGFRVPDVMKQSGARLVEVGATNRVNLDDYRRALEQEAAWVLHAHRSNFQLIGFVSGTRPHYRVYLPDASPARLRWLTARRWLALLGFMAVMVGLAGYPLRLIRGWTAARFASPSRVSVGSELMGRVDRA